MTSMKRLLLALFLMAFAGPAFADALVVATCGTLPLAYQAGATRVETQDINGNKCIGGTISATLSFPTIGAAVPATGVYVGINAAGTLTGWTGAVTNAGTFAVQAPITSWAGGTLGAMANYGTSPGAVLVPGVNAYVTAGAITETNSAALLSAVQGAIPAGTNVIGGVTVATWAGGTLGAMANYGTSPGAVLAPGVNAFITNVPAVSQSGTWNIGTVTTLPALPANQSVNLAQVAGVATPVGSGVMATAPRVALATDSPGIVTLGGATPANSVPVVGAGFTYAHISTSATTTVKSGAGVVHTITVNNLGTVASTTTVYDNTAGSGTVIAVINTLAGQISYIYDVAFATGLTLVTTGTVAPDITVSYR